MHARIRLPIIGLLVLLIFGGGVLIAFASAGTPQPSHPRHHNVIPPSPSYDNAVLTWTPNPYPPGISGIQPRTNGTPSFTAADVRQFVNTYGFIGGIVVKDAHMTIARILFIKSQEASKLIHGVSTDRPDNALVCYVQLHGPFLLTRAHRPPGVGNLLPVQFVFMVFDAHTGNLLLWGTNERAFSH